MGSRLVAYTGWKELALVDPEAHQGRRIMAMALPKVEMAANLPEELSWSHLCVRAHLRGLRFWALTTNKSALGAHLIITPFSGQLLLSLHL